MSDLEKGSSLHGWHKRVESLIWLAMSRAMAAFKLAAGATPLMNAISIENGAPIARGGGPGSGVNQVTFASAPFITPASGKVSVQADMNVLLAVTDTCSFQLIRDAGGVESILGPTQFQSAGTVAGPCSVSISWVDTSVAGGSHTYAIRCTNATSATLSVPAANETSVTLMGVT